MINEEAMRAVAAARWNARFGRPLYESFCFSRLPATVYRLLTGAGEGALPDSILGDMPRRWNKVILIVLDAYGWRFVSRDIERYPFLCRFAERGVVSPITTQFPSTTAAHMTTIHTGLPVGESGICEWFYYEPLVDRLIAPLLYSFAGDHARNTLAPTGVSPRSLYPSVTLYRQLKTAGVTSYLFQHRDYTPSPFSDVVFDGALVRPYQTLAEAFVNLGDAVAAESGPAYFFLYADTIDTIAHLYGPEARQTTAEIGAVAAILENVLHPMLAADAPGTLLLLTADHGQIDIDPATTLYLNRLDPSLSSLLRRSRAGELLVPGGSPRDMFLYVRDDCLEEATERLTGILTGRAEVHRTDDLVRDGLFGPRIAPALRARAGNLIILPYAGESVWWYEKDRFEVKLRGFHGGLTREEMETELMALAYP